MKWLIASAVVVGSSLLAPAAHPNVLVVITDDQGFGDLGRNGNPVVRTPNLDKFAASAVRFTNFQVCPVCSPTRSSLLTGLYNYRTGVVDTYLGRSMMQPGVRTLPEYLSTVGYRTGIFGKWHLGDNYPLRPEDRGFQTTLWHQGGGLAQPADPPPGNSYFDPVLKKDGKEFKSKGYCTDIFTDAAIEFVKADAAKPFFAYVAYNAPHSPYQVAEELAKPYKALDLSAAGFPKVGQPWATGKANADEIAKAYAMIEYIDANFAKLLAAVPADTVVVFLTDNGPGGVRFNGGLRNRKGTVYDGGIRVPCFVKWGTHYRPADITTPAAQIDLVPTILDICATAPVDKLDGRSLKALMLGGRVFWPDRTLFTQWHRGDEPEKYRAFAARGPRYKLVQAAGVAEKAKWTPKYELFDMQTDPFEQTDLAADKPDLAAGLKKQYEDWFADVTKAGFAPPRIVLGSDKENPVRLSRQDWRGPDAGWTKESAGYWEVTFAKPGKYKCVVIAGAEATKFELKYTATDGLFRESSGTGTDKRLRLDLGTQAGNGRLEAFVTVDGKRRGADWVEVEYVGDK